MTVRLILLGFLLCATMPSLLRAIGHALALRWGAWRVALALAKVVRPLARADAALLELAALKGLLRSDAALERTRGIVRSLPRMPLIARLYFANLAIETLIWAGRYEEALAVEAPLLAEDFSEFHESFRPHFALVEINAAEALYNLGRWNDAWGRLSRLDSCAKVHRITKAGLRVQRAWILSYWGRGNDAWDMLKEVQIRDLPPVYRSEAFYTRAMALLALQRAIEAREEIRRGLSIAKRPSSVRNGVFLIGRAELAMGNLSCAERWFAEGSQHGFRGQGGDGLLLWGVCLERLGRFEDARNAWKLAIQRDPESESAQAAKTRLASLHLGAVS